MTEGGGLPASTAGLLPRGPRLVVLAAALALILVALLVPWYELGDYRPTGWQASWWIRLAVIMAAAAALAARTAAPRTAVLIPAALALACVILRVVLPPDFGFDFDGLAVEVTREVGAWLGLAGAAVAAAAAALD